MDCIETPDARDYEGYGRKRWGRRHGGDGKMWLAHRRAWTEAHGPIPDGLCVLHACDNRPCINVEHLFLGTQHENIADMKSKGRGRTSDLLGSSRGNSKLNEAKVLEIRARYVPWKVTHRQLADEYGVNEGTIRYVLKRETWKHV